MKSFAYALALTCAVSTAAGASTFTTILSGANEVPPNASTGSGSATVSLVGDLLTVDVRWSGLAQDNVFGHIHCCGAAGTRADVAIPFVGLPSTRTGSFTHVYDLTQTSVYNVSFLAAHGRTALGGRDALVAGLADGLVYVNLHDRAYGGGEVRGQLAAVPEPAGLALFGLGSAVLGLARRKTTAPGKCRR